MLLVLDLVFNLWHNGGGDDDDDGLQVVKVLCCG